MSCWWKVHLLSSSELENNSLNIICTYRPLRVLGISSYSGKLMILHQLTCQCTILVQLHNDWELANTLNCRYNDLRLVEKEKPCTACDLIIRLTSLKVCLWIIVNRYQNFPIRHVYTIVLIFAFRAPLFHRAVSWAVTF